MPRWLVLALVVGCSGTKDSDTDASDTDTEDTDPVAPAWDWCPDASAFVGDAGWTGSLQATPRALYCSASNEGRTLEEELSTKAKLRLVAGTYGLPTEEGSAAIALPVCTERPPGTPHPEMAGAGSTDVNPQSFGGTTYTYLDGGQPMSADDGSWTLKHTIVLAGPEGSAPAGLVLDGQESDDRSGARSALTLVPAGHDITDNASIVLGPCDDDTWSDNVHTFTFAGGDLELHLHLGRNTILTGPGVIASAIGTLDGTAFKIDDFYRLLYRPDHHHFGRHFAVIFDAPIGDVCALRIEQVDTQVGTTTAVVSTANCDLTATGARAVTEEGFELVP